MLLRVCVFHRLRMATLYNEEEEEQSTYSHEVILYLHCTVHLSPIRMGDIDISVVHLTHSTWN